MRTWCLHGEENPVVKESLRAAGSRRRGPFRAAAFSVSECDDKTRNVDKSAGPSWRCRGLNPGPHTCEARALPLSYIPGCGKVFAGRYERAGRRAGPGRARLGGAHCGQLGASAAPPGVVPGLPAVPRRPAPCSRPVGRPLSCRWCPVEAPRRVLPSGFRLPVVLPAVVPCVGAYISVSV